MAKGSQLSQLKAALNQAGLARQPQNGKKRKRTAPDDREKEKKAAKLEEIQQKLNPFDVKVTKLKHDVGGRKIIGTVGRPAQSKQAGIEQRKKTLLKEYEEKNHAGGIVDRRFGENNPTITPEERMLERFTRERQRASKGAVFNLEDEDELTHYGQSLSKLDDFDNIGLGLDDDEDDGGQIGKDIVQKSHFGGFEDDENEDSDEPAKKRSKAEVMAEVVAKSKIHKLERQAQQEQDENLRHELDRELDAVRSLLYAPVPSTTPEAGPSRPKEAAPVTVSQVQDVDQEYDQMIRELAFDKRAKPKDRTKTEEELAQEEKVALEKAERRRIRRMNGEPEESDSENEGKGKKRSRQRGADDLDDDFAPVQEWGGLGAGLGDEDAEMDGDKDEEGESKEEDEEDGVEEGSEGSDDKEGSNAEENGDSVTSDGSGDEESQRGEPEALTTKVKDKLSKSKAKISEELPYTFPCPATHEEFLEIVEDIQDKDVPTVVQRIRTLHHPSLAEDNKLKLQALTGVLIDHILYVTSPPKPRFTLLTSLVPHLFALTKSYPIQSAQHFIEKLNLMHKNLKRGLSHGATASASKTWPGLPELSLLRTIGMVWPTSDMNHHVISPARILMGAYLGLCRVRSIQDLTSGLFLCTLFMQYEQLSKRLVPEAINFLVNTVLHIAPHTFKDTASLPGCFPVPDFRAEHCSLSSIDPTKAKKLDPTTPDFPMLMTGAVNEEQMKVDLLSLALELLSSFSEMYKSLDGFIELFEPVTEMLAGVKAEKLPSALATQLSSLKDALSRLLKFSRQARRPLRLQAHKPIPIATYIPKFEHSSSNYLRNRDPDHERNEAAKLRKQYKQERKGAIRELRKDARFLAAEQHKKEKEKDREYNDRMKKVFSSLESERAEEKAMDREKMKEKRRSGRK
ncbi:Nop14-like protein [Obba rivulosa]|uniref:Nop14-like protein n=1 Tax=Obba rivulosa TaxID=1052685 RepID=A0A8E2DRF5_9APHY|nr:Nop14-like protein [Obba rivulosa]